MKRLLLVPALLLAVALPGLASAEPAGQSFTAHLTGDAERPVPRETDATGQALFKVSKDGSEVAFKLIVANIENVTASHIHCPGTTEQNAPVAVFLYGNQPPGGGRIQGVIAEGTFPTTATCPGGMNVLDAMRAGLAYVNVHTNDGVAPANTGPGDFPGGEIRGQIEAGGPTP